MCLHSCVLVLCNFMTINSPSINYLWSSLIIDELVRCGVEYFCIAPGSRSAPLTVAAARHPKARHFIHYDERGLAFHALGFVSAQRKPAVLICTSGTAGANFYPAVIEASKKKLPLIVLTADRPPELRHTGAVQTIDQVGLFGKYTKVQMDLPCPDVKIKPEVVLTTIDQAVYQAARNPSGVAHVNCMFRDPLAPVKTGENFNGYLKTINSWIKSDEPYTRYINVGAGLKPAPTLDIKTVVRRIDNIKNGLIVVGKVGDKSEQKAVLSLAKHLGWPVFADASSGLRFGHADEHIVYYFDQILLSSKVLNGKSFDGILHLGGRMTSKRYYEFASKLVPKEYVMVLNHPLRNDPLHQVSLRIEAPVAVFCEQANRQLKPRKFSPTLQALIKANRRADDAMEDFFSTQESTITEPLAARLISQHIPQDSILFLANSMPIRDMEFYGDFKGNVIDAHGNRGASGIDGLVATACGINAGADKPVTLMIGDLALLHDLNSLAMSKHLKKPMVIVVLNNDGGGIFSFLPIANSQDVFEKFFGTPHGLTFEQAAGMFGLTYVHPKSANDFVRAYQQSLGRDGATLIEVKTTRKENTRVHQILQRKIVNAIEK